MKNRLPLALVWCLLLPVIAALLAGSWPPAFAARPATAGVTSAAVTALASTSLPATGAPDYAVVSITTLTTNGGRLDWSHDGAWIYYDRLEPDGFWDVYRLHPDGTGNECLTCNRQGLPNKNQGQPQMHPHGRYLVFQAEKAAHAGTVGHPSTGPGGGYFNDLWVLDLETGHFYQLTDVRSSIPAGGSLHAHFSNDGTKLLWSDLEGPGGRFGDWRLAVASFVVSPTPHLESHRYYNPGPQPIWLEAHGWGADDSWIYFTCTPLPGMDDYDQDICRMDFANPTMVTRLTFTSGVNQEPGEWDEHAHLSPLHDAFSWISSTPYGTEPAGHYGQWLQTEIWLMNVDGSGQRRITFFNDTEDVIVADNDWNPSAPLRASPATPGHPQLALLAFMRDRSEAHIKVIQFAIASPTFTPTPTATFHVPSSTLTPTPTATFPIPSPTFTPTPTATFHVPSSTSTPGHRLYLPLVLKTFPGPGYTPTPTATFHVPTSTFTPTPTPTWNVEPGTPTPTPLAIVLADGPAGLELVAAPVTLPLTVGHVAYLPIEVQNYHRPITVSAQTLIHTYVHDLTPAEPGVSPPFVVGTLQTAHSELKLQTLRMRTHSLTLTFTTSGQVSNLSYTTAPVGQVANLSHTITLAPAIQPHTPLFGLHGDPYYNGLPAPFVRVWGPGCRPCPTTPGDPPGSTRDIACAKQLNDSCNCHPFQEVLDAEADTRVRRRAPDMQRYASQFLRSIGGWGGIQHAPGQYLWDGLDWLFTALSPQERDYSPLFSGIMDGNFGWMTCPQYTNPDGSVGFFDPDNAYLVAQYRAHVRATTAHYAPDLRFVELSNEPAAEFYLCPCVAPGGTCTATSGPNQPACLLGPNSPEFVATYGDLLFTATGAAAEEMAATNPEALAITGALDLPPNDFGLSLTTQNLITRGLLLRDNVVIGIHQYPYLYPPNWISPTLNCAYYQKPGDPYWLPAGCETAPPFADYTTPAGRPIPARYAWQQFDQRVDSSTLLHDAQALGVLDRFYLFDTELHAGWHDGDPTTTPAREAMAGLRIGAINAHQRLLGSEFVFAPADPAAYNLLVKHLAGATPLYAWDAPLLDADYSGLVYKLFTRGQEDVIALWSNAETPQTLTLSLAPEPTSFRQVTLTRFADAHGPLAITTTNWPAPPATIAVQPLREFYFLSVLSDRPGFGWLAGLVTTPIWQ